LKDLIVESFLPISTSDSKPLKMTRKSSSAKPQPSRLLLLGPLQRTFSMPKPLRSEDPRPRDIQFSHFGVLNTGSQSKASLFTSVTLNVLLGLICLIIGAATKKVVDNRNKEIALVVPLPKPVEPPKPKLPPPPKIQPPPVEVKTPELPKIKLPDVPVPEPPKPIAVAAPKPVPVITPAPPKVQAAIAAPKVVNVSMAKAASVVNNDVHPTAIALGNPNSPAPLKNGPAVAAVNLRSGAAGMPPENSGSGPRATSVNMGSGSPGGKINGTSAVAVVGVPHGVIGGCQGCTGNGTGVQAQQVQIAHLAPPPQPVAVAVKAAASHPPTVVSKPKPIYTAEASSLHIEGTVTVKLHVSAAGTVTVMGVVAGLGHGLDQSAITAAQGIRFKPATDATGNPVDWEGPANIIFQIAS
jgi:periplasmic protein TonB